MWHLYASYFSFQQPCQRFSVRLETIYAKQAILSLSRRLPVRLVHPWRTDLIRLRPCSLHELYQCLASVKIFGFLLNFCCCLVSLFALSCSCSVICAIDSCSSVESDGSLPFRLHQFNTVLDGTGARQSCCPIV